MRCLFLPFSDHEMLPIIGGVGGLEVVEAGQAGWWEH